LSKKREPIPSPARLCWDCLRASDQGPKSIAGEQVMVNVQRALQEFGYYAGAISGSLGPATRRAISAYQQDEGLEINGVVDGPTVYALGLI